jgi:type IV pilus biogenesis/stability protein PilW
MSMLLYRISINHLLLAAVAVTLVVSGCATSEKNREEADLHLRLGTSLLAQGSYPSALRELLTAEKLDPENEVTQNNLGLAYFLRDKYELAEQHLARALKLKPSYSEARNNYGRVLIETGRHEQAIAELEKVTNDLTYQDPAKAWINLGMAYFRKNDFKSAKTKFSEAIRADRGNCLAHTYFGRTQLELGDAGDAARSLDNAVRICKPGKFDEAHYFSGLSYYKLGRTSDAVARMEEVKKINPDGPYAQKADSLLKLMK